MTLENLRYALYLNNLVLLDKIAQIKDTDIASLLQNFKNHQNDLVIHVTKEDKKFWNSTLENAKAYAKELFDGVTHMKIEIVETLPENPEHMVIYFVPSVSNTDEEVTQDYYDEYMFINDKWEVVGHTYVDLTPYLQREQFEKIIADYVTSKELATILIDYAKSTDLHLHENKNVLDKFSTSETGSLLFDTQVIQMETVITDEEIQAAIQNTLMVLNQATKKEEV